MKIRYDALRLMLITMMLGQFDHLYSAGQVLAKVESAIVKGATAAEVSVARAVAGKQASSAGLTAVAKTESRVADTISRFESKANSITSRPSAILDDLAKVDNAGVVTRVRTDPALNLSKESALVGKAKIRDGGYMDPKTLDSVRKSETLYAVPNKHGADVSKAGANADYLTIGETSSKPLLKPSRPAPLPPNVKVPTSSASRSASVYDAPTISRSASVKSTSRASFVDDLAAAEGKSASVFTVSKSAGDDLAAAEAKSASGFTGSKSAGALAKTKQFFMGSSSAQRLEARVGYKELKTDVKLKERAAMDVSSGRATTLADGKVGVSSGNVKFDVQGEGKLLNKPVESRVAQKDGTIIVTYKDNTRVILKPKLNKEFEKSLNAKGLKENDIAQILAKRLDTEASVVVGGKVSIGAGQLRIGKYTVDELSPSSLSSARQSLKKAREEYHSAENILQSAWRVTKAAPGAIWRFSVNATKFVGMILIQSIGFTLPTTLMHLQAEKAQKDALEGTVSAAQPFGDLFVQIPPSLINSLDASQSKFIYVEIPDKKKRSGAFFTPEFYANANYYVVYAGDYAPWASTYIGSPQFTGQMINLNTGWCFSGNVSVDDAKPSYPLRPRQTTNSQNPTVETNLNTFINVAAANATSYNPSIGASLFGIGRSTSSNNTKLDPIIKKLFQTGDKRTSSLGEVTGFVPPPPLMMKAISAYRTKRKLPGFGNIALREMQGTGFVNHLLSPQIKWEDPNMQPLYAAINNLLTKQIAYDKAIVTGAASGVIQAASQDVVNAENAVSALTSRFAGKAGMNTEEDINLYNIYVYEISTDPEDVKTPSLDFLLKNVNHSAIPVAEYVVCLDSGGNIVPLLVPSVVEKLIPVTSKSKNKNDDGATTKTFTVDYIVNPAITYISSLTTGLTYLSNGTGQLSAPLTNSKGVPDFAFATNALNVIYGSMQSVGQTVPSIKSAFNQISDMTAYLVNKASAGPLILANGYQLERVPLDAIEQGQITAETIANDALSDMSDILSGVSLYTGAVYATPTQNFIDMVQKNIYLYKVTIPGVNGSPSVGALSYMNSKSEFVDIPDYIIAVTPSSDKQTQTILPLGLNTVTGSATPPNTQFLMSLITGRIYDSNYNLLAPSITGKIIDRSYTTYIPTTGDLGSNIKNLNTSTKNWPTMQSVVVNPTGPNAGEQVLVDLPYLATSLATGYMPTPFNPNNIIFVNAADKKNYQTTIAALSAAQSAQAGAVAAVNKLLGAVSSARIPSQILSLYSSSIVEQFDFAEKLSKSYSGITLSLAKSLKSALDQYQAVTSKYNVALEAYNLLQSKVDAGVVPTVTAGDNEKLEIPPLYFAYFSRFSYAKNGGVFASDVSPLPWVNFESSLQSEPIALSDGSGAITPIPLANILPKEFLGFDPKNPTMYYPYATSVKNIPSLLNTYYMWASSESSKYWVQNALIGPFNFTGSSIAASDKASDNYYNVFLTATSRADVANGNFFYRATGFDQSDIFVVGRTKDVATPLTKISELQDLGKPFVMPGGPNWYMINLSTGCVYTPYSTGVTGTDGDDDASSSLTDRRCIYYKDALGNRVNVPNGSSPVTQKWWTLCQAGRQISSNGQVVTVPLRFNTEEVVKTVLSNTVVKGRSATAKDLTPSLQQMIANVQAIGKQLTQQSLYPFYFNNQFILSLREDQIENGSYIYAVVNNGESYLSKTGPSATDYLVVCSLDIDDDGNLIDVKPIPSPLQSNTTSMISLVTGTVYTSQLVSNISEWYVLNGYNITETPSLIIKMLPKVAPDIASACGELNQKYIYNKKQAQAASVESVLPSLNINALTPYTNDQASTYRDIYMSNESGKTKYYVKSQTPIVYPVTASDGTVTPTSGFATMYFDFKASLTTIDQDQVGDYGLSYSVNPITNAVKPGQVLSGYMLQAMRSHNGVYVSSDGTQTLGIPVADISLPKGDNEATLVPEIGKDGQYMRFFNQYGTIQDVSNNADYSYYQNTAINGLFAAVRDKGVTVTDKQFLINPATSQAVTPQIVKNPDQFVDLSVGAVFDIKGMPMRKPVEMAFKHLRPRFNVETLPGIKAAKLPLSALQNAAPVTSGTGNVTDDLYLVGGKYYYKSVGYTPVVDMYGNTQNDPDGNQLIAQTVRYFDFNGSDSTISPTLDTGVGIWYQVTIAPGNVAYAVPIDDSFVDNPNDVDELYLTDMRNYYGVEVYENGTQQLTTPVTQGVDYTKAFFAWGNESPFDQSFAVSAMYHDGQVYALYNYVPLSRVYKFTSQDGLTLYDYSYVPSENEILESDAKVKVSTTSLNSQIVQEVILNVNMGDAIQNAIDAGYILYAVQYELEAGEESIIVDETMLTPKTYTIQNDKNEYLQILPNITYQTSWEKTIHDTPQEVEGYKAIGNNLVKGVPFVAEVIGGRPQGSLTAPTLTGGEYFVVGIVDRQTGGLLSLVAEGADENGVVSTQYCITQGLTSERGIPKPGTLIPYYSVFGTQIYAMTSNYPALVNPISGSLLNQGHYITIQSDSTNEYLYKYINQYVSQNQLDSMKSKLNIVTQSDGVITLAYQILTKDLAGVPGVQGSMANALFFTMTPDQRVLYKIPPVDKLKSYYASDKRTYIDISGFSISSYQNYADSVGIYPVGSYIDYETGVVFVASQTDSTVFYPISVGLSPQALNLIHDQFENRLVQWDKGVPYLESPENVQAKISTRKP